MPVWLVVAAWIGEQIASGIVSHIGAQVWGRMTGEWDLRDLYNHSIDKISQLLDAAVNRLETDQAIDAATEAKDFLNQYLIDKTQVVELDNAERLSLQALTTFQRLGLPTFGSFMVQAGLHLAVLQERYSLHKTPSQLEIIRQYYHQHTGYVWQAYNTFTDSIRNSFSGVKTKETQKSETAQEDPISPVVLVIRHTVTCFYEAPPFHGHSHDYVYYTLDPREEGHISSLPISLPRFDPSALNNVRNRLEDERRVDIDQTIESKSTETGIELAKLKSIVNSWAQVAQVVPWFAIQPKYRSEKRRK
jgi:hypothetical protein